MAAEELEEAINTLKTGAAICFLGAGFARAATDSSGKKEVPSTEGLAEEICDMIGVPREAGGTLSDLADYCEGDGQLGPKLNALLINRLTHCIPSEHQKKIIGAPWRSIFTTNFDDIAERTLSGKSIQIITPTSDA